MSRYTYNVNKNFDFDSIATCEYKGQQWVKLTKEQEKDYSSNEYAILLIKFSQIKLILCKHIVYHYRNGLKIKYEPIKIDDIPYLDNKNGN